MKYIKLFENFEPHDPYELMIIPPNKKAEMIMEECAKKGPNLNLINDLILLGANLDWQDEKYGKTSLHWATQYWGNVEIVRMLIDAGADVNLKDNNGDTPLHIASSSLDLDLVLLLLNGGADPNVKDNSSRTPRQQVAPKYHYQYSHFGQSQQDTDYNRKTILDILERWPVLMTIRLLRKLRVFHWVDLSMMDLYAYIG